MPNPGTSPPASGAGGFEVLPAQLYRVSDEVAAEQGVFHTQGRRFASEVHQGGAAGRGTASEAFAHGYDPLAKGVAGLWAKSVVSVGGAAVGFTETANNFVAADHRTDPKATGSPPQRQPPQVIAQVPHYPAPPSVLRGAGDGGDSDLREVIGDVADWEAAVLDALMKKLKGVTRLADVYPWADPGKLDRLADAWTIAANAARIVAQRLDTAVAAVTDKRNDEWQAAARKFCSSLWGTSAWGREQDGVPYAHDDGTRALRGNKPIITVLTDAGDTAAACCANAAHSARTLQSTVKRLLREAAKATVKELLDFDVLEKIELGLAFVAKLVSIFLDKLDHEALDAAVTAYEDDLHTLARKMKPVHAELEEASSTPPTYHAEEARAEGYGARALADFKQTPLYTVPGDSADNHKYEVDLANQEDLAGAHVIDKHVGKTGEQLAARLRDQPRIPAASAFDSLAAAQRYTQETMDDPDNKDDIRTWLEQCERTYRRGRRPSNTDVEYEFPPGTVTGHTVTRADYDSHGLAAQGHATRKAKVVLKYRHGEDPPYVVLTAMPE